MLKLFYPRSIQISYEKYINRLEICKRYAGHSKWANIRHIKGAKDAERNKIFTKLGRQMKVAVQAGGSVDPMKNLQLSQVIDQAKRFCMPAATIQSLLKSCENDKSNGKSYILEIRGPGSCFILCEVYTNHVHSVKMNITTILKKHQSKFCDGILHFFEEKGIIIAEHELLNNKPEADILAEATDHAIESSAEDVNLIDNNILQFNCGKTNLIQVVGALEKLGYKVNSAEVDYNPIKLHSIEEADLQICQKLFNKLEELPEVVKIVDNIA